MSRSRFRPQIEALEDRLALSTSGLTLGTNLLTAGHLGIAPFAASQGSLTEAVLNQTVKSLAVKMSVAKPTVNVGFSISVTALDANGKQVAGDNGMASITVISAPPSAQFTGPLSVRFDAGRATFSGLVARAAGTYTIRVEDMSSGVSRVVTFSVIGR
jgi:hypothetical protein